jgi:hypothetical protein
MPLELYNRNGVYWVRGRAADSGQYLRKSLGTSDPELAAAEVRAIEAQFRKRRILGPDAPKPEDELTFNACIQLYEAKPAEARYLAAIVRRIGNERVKTITPQGIRSLAKKMFPDASTDTWQRQVVTPVRSVINNAHELGMCPPIRVRAFGKAERVEQDRLRGKESRPPIQPGSWPWVLAFCAAADPRDAALARFMFTKGARIGQSIAMRRDRDMDLSAGRIVQLHRLITRAPTGYVVDHIDGDTLNNQRENLQVTTNSRNLMRGARAKAGGIHCRDGRYVARIRVDGAIVRLGTFPTEPAARQAIEAAKVEAWGLEQNALGTRR